MAIRCPRCQKNEIALETFGIYRCPACGRIDADGNMLDIAAPPPEGAPEGRASFAAPPPKEWVPPPSVIAPVVPRGGTEADGPPNLLYGGIALVFFVSLANALTSGNWISTFLRWGTLGALWTGRPWARSLSIAGSLIGIALVAFVMAALRGQVPPSVTILAVVSVVTEVGWLYVMFRPETVKHFMRRA